MTAPVTALDLDELARHVASNGGRLCSPEAAVTIVERGHRVMIPIGSQPLALADAVSARVGLLGADANIEFSDCAVAANYLWLQPGFPGVRSVVHEHWGGPVVRKQLRAAQHDYVPIPFSLRFKAVGELARTPEEARPIDVVMVQVSLPDEHGYVSFGPNAWNQLRFVEEARFALAEMSDQIYPAFGRENSAHVSKFHALVFNSSARRLSMGVQPNEAEISIARHLSGLIQDGDTIQVGAGSATTACIYAGAFDSKQDLGWHSEASVGRIIDLIRDGVFTGMRKSIDRGLAVATGYAGSPEQMEFVRLHPGIHTRSTEYVHNVRTISSLDNMVAINAALAVDLTGQIAADSMGPEIIGGTGGQLEFAIGAINAKNGRSVTVLESRALGGSVSTIVPLLPEGTVVTVPRLFADIVVTEYGVARLWGKTVRERAAGLTSIAHPDHRDYLRAQARVLLGG